MNIENRIKNYVSLAREIGIPQERFKDIFKMLFDLVEKNAVNKEIYNTFTANLTEREMRIAFYMWGNCSDLDGDFNDE